MNSVKKSFGFWKASVLSLFLLTPGVAFSQANNYHKYIDMQSHSVTRAIDTDGNDFVLTGHFTPGTIGGLPNNGDRIHLTKLDNNLAVQWNKTYVMQTEYDNRNLAWTLTRAYDVKPTMDGGFIVCGEMIDEGTANNPFLMKTDGAGAVQWFKIYWGTDRGRLNSVIETPNGDFVTCGYGVARASSDEYARVMKTDANGAVLWTKEVYGNMLNSNGDPYYSRFNEVTQYGDNYALVGICNNYFFLSITDVLVTVVDDNGGTVNNWIYGVVQDEDGNHINEYGKSIIADGSDLLIGGTYDAIEPDHCFSVSTDAMIFKIDNAGNLIFQKRYDLGSVESGQQITWVNDKAVLVGNSSPDAFLLDVDKNDGTPLAAEKYNYNDQIFAHSLVLDAADDIRFVGNTPNLMAPPMDYDWTYLVQQYAGRYQQCNDWETEVSDQDIPFERPEPSDANLTVDEIRIDMLDFDITPDERGVCLRDDGSGRKGSSDKSSLEAPNSALTLSLEALPNPSADHSVVRYYVAEAGEVSVKLYDQTGRVVISLVDKLQVNAGSYSHELNTSAVAAGSYILKLEINGKTIVQNITIVK